MGKVVAACICLVLASCANQSTQSHSPIYPYDGGQVTSVNMDGDCITFINGAITKSLSTVFSNVLKPANHQACREQVVLIQSHGGDIDVAMHIGQQIRDHKMSTDMHGYCESACAFIFVGGVHRYVHKTSQEQADSRLGVHQPASELLFHRCIPSETDDPRVMQRITQYLFHMLPGAGAEDLKNLLFETSCHQIAYLDATALLQMHIATENIAVH